MAKNKNSGEVTAGLTGSLLDGLDFGANGPGVTAGGAQAPQQRPQDKPLAISAYAKKKRVERRNVKLNILLKPYLSERMIEAKNNGEIKSQNDLIVTLLERHFALDDAIKEGKIKTQEDLLNFVAKQYLDA